MSSAMGLKISAIAAEIKKYKSIIKKKKKHDKILLLAKSKLNRIEVLISKALIDSNISCDEFVLINNVLKEYDKIKDLIKFIEYFSLFIKQCYHNVLSVEKIQKVKIQKLQGKKGRIMLLSKCAVCDSRKSEFIKEYEASGLLSSLAIKTYLSTIPLVGPLLF